MFKYYLGERDDRFGRSRASASVQRVWNAGGDLWITGMVTYIPLRTKITLDIRQQNRTLASNTFDISANPVLATVLLNFRF
ncbi:hypothetical protein [Burkholderia ubonensis]|uniref:hypothetical protein n=1 Tax=Burkholderia ubonensis TaxID=101571 RepID=UPI000ACB7CF3